jgi:hypothetical protein
MSMGVFYIFTIVFFYYYNVSQEENKKIGVYTVPRGTRAL